MSVLISPKIEHGLSPGEGSIDIYFSATLEFKRLLEPVSHTSAHSVIGSQQLPRTCNQPHKFSKGELLKSTKVLEMYQSFTANFETGLFDYGPHVA